MPQEKYIERRDKQRRLWRRDRVWVFVFVTKRRKTTRADELKEVINEEFRVVVKQEKILITSSMFSKRDHSAFKCAMHCGIIMRVLVRHCT